MPLLMHKIFFCNEINKEEVYKNTLAKRALDTLSFDLEGELNGPKAMAYGTESIPKVDKIVGPGNIYVATSKTPLYGVVDIDMVAGPSEILVLADHKANPRYIAADLMSQAEHDKLASAILVTTSEELADKTIAEIERQVQYLSRKEIIEMLLKAGADKNKSNKQGKTARDVAATAVRHLF